MAYQSKYTGLQIDDILDSVEWKQGKIEDLASIRAGAAKGATALQSYTEKYTGTVTGIKINGVVKSGSGVIDLGTITTDISGKQDKLVDGVNIATINGQSLTAGGDITIEGGAKIYEWFYDGESKYVLLSQEEYDNIVGADIVVVNIGGVFSVAVSKSGKEFSEAMGNYVLIGQLESLEAGVKAYININIEISTKVATITVEEQNVLTKTSQLENDSNFVTSEDVAAVAISGSYNDLTNKPTIPSAVTESTVSGWGFTKNTGTYSKPSGGIPKTDLASEVQTSLGKADTALQSYTEQYKGTVTGVKINGTTKNPSSGIVDLGTVITSHQDVSGKQDKLVSGTNIKTINGTSILGSGDITISGGSSSGGGSGAYAEVNHGTSDTTFTLTPNTFHVWDEVSALTLTLGSETSGVANEYLFQFTSGATATSLSLPSDLKWANDSAPTIAENMIYQVSILKGLASVLEFSNAPALIENKVTVSISGTKYLVSLQYAAASDIVVKVRTVDGPISVNILSGETSKTASPAGPMIDSSAYIESITPAVDNNYTYIW